MHDNRLIQGFLICSLLAVSLNGGAQNNNQNIKNNRGYANQEQNSINIPYT